MVARENKELTIESVENLLRKGGRNSEVRKNCIKHVRRVEKNTGKLMELLMKVNRFIISVGGSEDQSDIDTDDLSTDEGDINDV